MTVGAATAVRVGHLYPSGGICDSEIQLMAPDGVQFLTTRLPFRRTGLADDLALAENLEFHAQLVADAAVELIAFNCTAASMLIGSADINDRITAATGVPSVTTIEAVLEALRHREIRRIALLTPYPSEVEDAEIAFLADEGFTVVSRHGPVCATPVEQGSITPEEWRAIAEGIDVSDADAVLLSCAGAQVAASIAAIESALERPVVTSNQALLWKVLRTLQIDARRPGFGRLLEEGA